MSEKLTEVDRLERELAKLKQQQAGSDRTVTQLKKEREDLNAEWQKRFATLKTEKESALARVEELQAGTDLKKSMLDRKEKVLELALEKGIKPQEAFDLLGLSDKDDEEVLDGLLERETDIRLEERENFLKKHGRKVETGLLDSLPDYKGLQQMTDREIQSLGSGINRIMDKELKKQRPTVKKRLWEAIS